MGDDNVNLEPDKLGDEVGGALDAQIKSRRLAIAPFAPAISPGAFFGEGGDNGARQAAEIRVFATVSGF
jgi:hypothetical protein